MRLPIAAERASAAKLGVGPNTFSIGARLGAKASCLTQCNQLAQFLSKTNAAILSQRVFSRKNGPCDYLGASADDRRGVWPVSRLNGNGGSAGGRSDCCCQLAAAAGSPVTPIEIGGELVGGVYEDEKFRFCVIGNLLPEDFSAPRCAQAESVWRRIEMALAAAGMTLTDVVRTWFFVDHILEWYADFNAVRSRIFDARNLLTGVLPASTGVGIANSAGAALATDLLAIKPKRGRLNPRNVDSPLQCPAMQYRSSFSRALELSIDGSRLLFVSGTASIGPDGLTAHVGDIDRQVALTMAVVEKILGSRQLTWADVTRGVAYFKDIGQADVLERYCIENSLPSLPLVVASADICRDDLLFEIEVDAACKLAPE